MSEDALLVKSAGAKSSIYLSAIANNLPPAELPIGNFNIPLAGAQKLTTRNGDTVLLSPCPRKNTRMEGLIAIANLTLWFLSLWMAPFLLPLLVYQALVKVSPFAWMIICSLTCGLFIPAGTEWRAFRQSKLWDTWHRYFQCQYITPELPYLQPGRHYLFAQFPHAVFPMSSWLAMIYAGRQGSGNAGDVKGAIADIFFSLPFVKHNYAWIGCVGASKKVMMETLKHYSLACLPEGIAGIFQGASPLREAVYLSNRKGFIKLAIQSGSDLVPMYTLGQSQLLTFKGSEVLSRKYKISLGIWFGWYYLPIPRPHKLITIVGKPISVKQDNCPSQQAVDELHACFVQQLTQMYNEHRHHLGWDTRPLQIV